MAKRLKYVLALSIISIMPTLFGANIANAQSDIEAEFNSVKNQYKLEDVIVENGIALRYGETLDLSENPNWKLSNNNTVKIDENGVVTPIQEGTVFLSQQIGDKAHIIEIYVSNNDVENLNLMSTPGKQTYKVFVDAGHGGGDSGALGNGYKESDINLQVAKKVENELKSKGIEVKMSRTSDVFLELSERARLSNEYQADAFISIHQNSATETASGIETFYHPDKISYKPLSDKIQTNLINNTGAKNRGVKSGNLAVLRLTNKPSSLVECGFITNRAEASKISNSSYQDTLAKSIANGVEEYLKENIEIDSLPVLKTGIVNTSSLNVRSGYSSSASLIGGLSKGTKVEIVGEQNGWYKIIYGSGYGHVSGAYITLDTPVVPPTNPETGFSDIKGNWAEEKINDFANKGYINGYEDNTFRPQNNISRAEFVKVVNKVFGLTQTSSKVFIDVPNGYWAKDEIDIAVTAGVAQGFGGEFRPNDNITRQEAAKMLGNYKKLSDTYHDKIKAFPDYNQVDNWALNELEAIVERGYIQGTGDGRLAPKANMSRAEAVTVLSRIK